MLLRWARSRAKFSSSIVVALLTVVLSSFEEEERECPRKLGGALYLSRPLTTWQSPINQCSVGTQMFFKNPLELFSGFAIFRTRTQSGDTVRHWSQRASFDGTTETRISKPAMATATKCPCTSADSTHPAVAEPDVGGLHDHRHAIEQDDLMAPVKLIGFSRRKAQRDVGRSR
jgi:hypothetical protein